MDFGFRAINDLPHAHWDETEFRVTIVVLQPHLELSFCIFKQPLLLIYLELKQKYWNKLAFSNQLTLSNVVGWLCWGLTSQSTIFQSCRDGAIASWVINQYFRGVKCLAQGHNTAEVGLEPRTSRSGVRHSTTEPPRSPCQMWKSPKFIHGVSSKGMERRILNSVSSRCAHGKSSLVWKPEVHPNFFNNKKIFKNETLQILNFILES